MTKFLYDGFHKIEEVTASIKRVEVTREKLHLPSAVGGLVVDQHKRLLLVNQYRPTIGKKIWEIPAGILDKPLLTPYETLIEELEEECEIPDSDILVGRFFQEYFMLAGSSDAKMYLYRVKALSNWKRREVQDKDVEVAEWFTYSEVARMFIDGEFVDPKTIIAVSSYLQ